MKAFRFLVCSLAAASLFFLGSTYVRQNNGKISTKTISIEGTYKLVSRKYADGKVTKPPAVIGMVTFTKEYRIFNFMWVDSSGNHTSESVVSKYKLTDKKYSETNVYRTFYNEKDINSKDNGITLGTNRAESSAVAINGTKISFRDVVGPPILTFEGNIFTAAAKGMFTDYWVKIK